MLDRLGPRALSSHLRRFCDYLAFELANSTSNLFQRVSLFIFCEPSVLPSGLVRCDVVWEIGSPNDCLLPAVSLTGGGGLRGSNPWSGRLVLQMFVCCLLFVRLGEVGGLRFSNHWSCMYFQLPAVSLGVGVEGCKPWVGHVPSTACF